MKKIYAIGLIILIFLVGKTNAVTIEIKENAASSSNVISIQDNKNTSINQKNNLEIKNVIEATAETGNNNASGNTNGNTTIQTGNATVNVNINNQGNSNVVHSTKKTTPTPSVSPTSSGTTPTTPSKPTNTPLSQNGSNQSSSGHSSSSSRDSESKNQQNGGIGGGEVKGLAATSGIDYFSLLSSIGGFLCLFIGSALLNKREL